MWNIEDGRRRRLSVHARDSMDFFPLRFGRSIGGAQAPLDWSGELKIKGGVFPKRGFVGYLDFFPSLYVIWYPRGVLPNGLILGNFISLVIITHGKIVAAQSLSSIDFGRTFL